MASENKKDKQSGMVEKFIENFDLYRDSTTWCNFLDNKDEKLSLELKTKINKFNLPYKRLSFDLACRIETIMLHRLIKHLTEEELKEWDLSMSHLRAEEVKEKCKSMNQEQADSSNGDGKMDWSPINKETHHLVSNDDEYFQLVDRLGHLIADKCATFEKPDFS
jgi:hypothetical protein